MKLLYDFVFDIGAYLLVAIFLICITTVICVAITRGHGYLYDGEDAEDDETTIHRSFE